MSSTKKLTTKQKKRNKQLSSVRSKVEHPFRILKCQFGFREVMYKGLEKEFFSNKNEVSTMKSL